MDPLQFLELSDPTVTYALVATGVGLGLIGVLILIVARNVRARVAGALLFPFLPSVVLFAIFPTTSVATIDYIGKLAGPIAAYLIFAIWMRNNVVKDAADDAKLQEYSDWVRDQELKRPLQAGPGPTFSLAGGADQTVQILQGDIRQLIGPFEPDVIVNSENDFLMLGRPYDRNVSGMLRYLDAKQDDGRLMLEDSLDINLRERLRNQRLPVAVGAVFETRTSGLANLGVSYIFHVATVTTIPGGGFRCEAGQLPICVDSCFQMFERLVGAGEHLESMLFPLMGAGDGSLSSSESAQTLMPAIVAQMRAHPSVKTVYLLAFRGVDLNALVEAAKGQPLQQTVLARTKVPASAKAR